MEVTMFVGFIVLRSVSKYSTDRHGHNRVVAEPGDQANT